MKSNIQSIKIPKTVKKIAEQCFSNCDALKNVEIPEDSELQIIEARAFQYSNIQRIFIPEHVKILENEVFNMCKNLNHIEIPENSELKIIKRNTFCLSFFYSFYIPSKLTVLEDGWLNNLSILNKITVSPDNPRYSMYKNQLLIGKSSIEQENYDVLIYCPRSIEGNIQIPDFIEIISPHAFENCKKIQQVEFSPDSKLRIIGNSSFSNLDIERINIPAKVTQICDKSFFLCHKLKEIKIQKNSELEMIGELAFYHTFIGKISIPSKVTELKKTFLSGTLGLSKISVSRRNQLYSAYAKGKAIIKKSSNEQQNYDILVFCLENYICITIPSFIKILADGLFLYNKDIRRVNFQHDSKL